jgi:hypothetical protein
MIAANHHVKTTRGQTGLRRVGDPFRSGCNDGKDQDSLPLTGGATLYLKVVAAQNFRQALPFLLN